MIFFFLLFTCFCEENWASADVMIFKAPILFLRGENIATLGRNKPKTPEHCHKKEVFKFAAETLERSLYTSLSLVALLAFFN